MSKKQKETIDKGSDSEEQYQVEVILAARAVRKGKWQYLVKWHGYPDSENSWEPGNGLTTCKALISRFWKDVDIDSSQRKAIPRGSIVHASDTWIQYEKQNFETNIAPTHGNEELEDSDVSSSDSNVPLSAKLALDEGGTKAKHLKRKRIPSLSSYSDEPLPVAVETKRKQARVSGRRNTSTAGPHLLSGSNPPNVTDSSVRTGPGDQIHSPSTARPQICNEAVVSSSEVLGLAPPNHAIQIEASLNSTIISPPINQTITFPSLDPPVLSPKLKAPTHRRPVRVKELTYSEVPGADETIAFGNSTKRRVMQGSALQPLKPTSVSKDRPADAPKNPLIASSTRQPPDNTLPEVDAFLDSIVLPDAPTNYRWEGELKCYALSKECGRVSVIAHSTACSDGTRLAQVLPTALAALTFSSFYHTGDVIRQLKDRKVSVTASLISEATSKQAVDALAGYATKNSLCLIMVCEPGLDSLADALIFFPPGSSLRSYFNISEPLHRPQLLVALVSTSPPSSPRSKHHLSIPNQPKLNEYRRQHSISLLKFPEWLHSLLTSRKSNCCIWYDGSATCDMQRRCIFEVRRTNDDTWMLAKIIERYTRLNPSPKDFYYSDVSVVFVHVSAVRTLHRLPKFVNRLWKQSEMAVVTYGTHYSVPPSMWGIKLIYPAGGLVSFSPNAFLQDPTGVFDQAMNIARHQMWCLWLTPLTLGCIIRTFYHGQDPVAQFDDGNFVLQFLLDAIDDGKFSFCSHPPSESSFVADVQVWVAEQEIVVAGGPRELLEYALQIYDSFIQSDSDSESVLRALCSGVRLLQLHPMLMQKYRRFVIVCTETEMQTHKNDQFEWRTTDTFHFNYKSVKAR